METFIQALVGTTFIFVFYVLLSHHSKPNFKTIPAVGGSGWFSSYITAIKFITQGQAVIDEGRKRYPSSIFKIPGLTGWQIVVTSPEHVNDIRRAPEEDLSLGEAQNDVLGMEYTIGWERGIHNGEFAKAMYRMLTKNFIPACPDLYDETVKALDSLIHLDGDNWTSVSANSMILNVITRVSNRLFVGLPLCQDPEYIKLVIDYSEQVPLPGMIIKLFPTWMQRFVAYFISPLPRNTHRANKILGPYLEERLKLSKEHGSNWEDKPNDMITWLLEEESEVEASKIAMRILSINFGGLLSSSTVLAHALYHLAASQEYIPILRKEVESITMSEGWTKTAVGGMLKLDSFLRETTRLSGLLGLTLLRKVMKPAGFTFSDGTVLPQGTHVAVSAYAIHRQADLFENPEVFDGLRFYNMRDSENEDEIAKEQTSTPSMSNLLFGLGKHVCPGRFFVTHNIKVIIAHIIVTYDIKFSKGIRPLDQWVKGNCLPNSKAEIMFRKRQT